jgi:hypothetical protein
VLSFPSPVRSNGSADMEGRSVSNAGSIGCVSVVSFTLTLAALAILVNNVLKEVFLWRGIYRHLSEVASSPGAEKFKSNGGFQYVRSDGISVSSSYVTRIAIARGRAWRWSLRVRGR